MHEREETEARAGAMEARDLVLGLALGLARRAIVHVEENPAVQTVVMDDAADAGGHEWTVRAYYGRDHAFVRVDGEPRTGHGAVVSLEEMAAIMGNREASFSVNVPRAWIDLAVAGAEAMPS